MATFDDPLVERIYQQGLVKIERVRAANHWEDGILVYPFVCWLCETKRDDLAMMNGDGLPICVKCLGFHPSDVPGLDNERRSW